MADQAIQKLFRRWVESGDPLDFLRYARADLRAGGRLEDARGSLDGLFRAGFRPGVGARELARDIDEALRRHPHNESRALSYLSNRGWRIGPAALKRGPGDFAPNDMGRLRHLRNRAARESGRLRDLPSARQRREAFRRLRRGLPRVGGLRSLRGRAVPVAAFLALLLLLLGTLLYPAGEVEAGGAAVDCDCASIDFGLLTDAVQEICRDREAELLELQARGLLELVTDSARVIREGETCDAAARGELGWPAEGELCPTGTSFCRKRGERSESGRRRRR